MSSEARRATIVGAGPNGLSAGTALASAGFEVVVLERAEVAGGGVRTEDLALPGFRHDVCSAVHPLAVASPFFRPPAEARFATPDPALFLCSASTPPGGGVHDMCGSHAAASACRRRLPAKRLIPGPGGGR